MKKRLWSIVSIVFSKCFWGCRVANEADFWRIWGASKGSSGQGATETMKTHEGHRATETSPGTTKSSDRICSKGVFDRFLFTGWNRIECVTEELL